MKRWISAGLLVLLGGCAAQKKEIDEVKGLDLGGEGISQAFGAPLLQSYQSCDQLKNDLKETALRENATRMAYLLEKIPSGDSSYPVPGVFAPGSSSDVAMAPPPMAPVGAESGVIPPSAPREGIDFSGTNNQEKGVDEADIIKIDGKFFYILKGNSLQILAIEENGALTPASTLSLPYNADALLLMGDKALVISELYSWELQNMRLKNLSRSYTYTRIDLVDLSADRKSPSIVQSNYFEGHYKGARTIGGSFYLATYNDLGIEGLRWNLYPSEDFWTVSVEEQKQLWTAMVARLKASNDRIINNFDFLSLLPNEIKQDGEQMNRTPLSEGDCNQSYGATEGSATGFVNLVTINPEANGANVAMQWVKGNEPIVYASPDQFVLAAHEHKDWWFYKNKDSKEQTSIHRFKLGTGSLPYYADSVRIDGKIHNSFSLSEYQGYLRIATTTSGERRFFEPESNGTQPRPDENHLFILGEDSGKLDIISSIQGLAPGEKIWSARFSKDKGFIVTFKQVDPLFTLDLRDPKNPKVAGVLKVPGVSTYLQDIGNDQVLAVGYGGDDKGLDWKTTVSLFDVSDFNNPQLARSLSLSFGADWQQSESEANRNHLAITYWGPAQMTAIPLSAGRWNQASAFSNQNYEHKTKLMLVSTAPEKALSIFGEIDHSKYYNNEGYFSQSNIRRSYFVGDFVYAFSANAITATKLSDMSAVNEVVF